MVSEYHIEEQIQQDTSDAAMTQAIEASLLALPRQIARVIEADIHDAPDLFWATSGVSLGMSNGVYRSILTPDNADAAIVQVQEEFRRRNLPLMWQVGPSSQPLDLRQRLLAHGFTHSEDEPGMALDILAMNEDFPVPPELEIRVADDLPMLHTWVATWGFGVPGDKLPLFQDIYSRLGISPDIPWRYYLGFFQGKPVATSQLFIGAGVAAVHDVATFPEMRARGIGTAMTLAALRDARQMGYRIAVLTASPYGERIYRRIGFRDYGTISRYDWRVEDKSEKM
jgi:GNAT superfamily N-acetyltransferase